MGSRYRVAHLNQNLHSHKVYNLHIVKPLQHVGWSGVWKLLMGIEPHHKLLCLLAEEAAVEVVEAAVEEEEEEVVVVVVVVVVPKGTP